MAGVNKVILLGYLGKDPELKYGGNSGKAVCRFSLAINERRGNEDHTEWFNIVCFERIAEVANEYLAKGKPVFIEGRLSTRKYKDRDGQEKYMTEVLASQLTLLGGGSDREGRAPASKAPDPKPAAAKPKPRPQDDPFSGDYGPPPSEDDMPF